MEIPKRRPRQNRRLAILVEADRTVLFRFALFPLDVAMQSGDESVHQKPVMSFCCMVCRVILPNKQSRYVYVYVQALDFGVHPFQIFSPRRLEQEPEWVRAVLHPEQSEQE